MSLTADDRHDLTILFASTMQLTGAFPLQATGQFSAGKFKVVLVFCRLPSLERACFTRTSPDRSFYMFYIC
ncbi:hypothetical protein [Paenibacillus solani]|uniref:hypothetical protein n=1 Tax=Paenibacillus solani TaxID=1705565 RepID=UPI000B2225B1|nr:hypothetical protein [Paenibacillus solani]